MIDSIFRHETLQAQPPVLVDIGASGEIHAKWKDIAKYSVCIAFDADDREMSFAENSSSGFRKLITINRIVTDQTEEEVDFYLTRSPFCSSTLEPDLSKLSAWTFQDLFQVENKIKLKAVRLTDALKNAGVTNIDWLKIDTQGTDLRLFKTLPESIRNSVLVAEFEPGIIDAYKGEDKLYDLISYMTGSGFYMSSLDIKGTQRVNPKTVEKFGLQGKLFSGTHRISPGWGEVCYMNTLSEKTYSKREYMLAYAFALIEKQYAFALEIAEKAKQNTNDSFFNELSAYALIRISRNKFKWPFVALKNKFDKAFNAVFK